MYNIKTGIKTVLPNNIEPRDTAGLIHSNKYGLIVLGGNGNRGFIDSVERLPYNKNTNILSDKWIKMPNMFHCGSGHTCTFFQNDFIFKCGGLFSNKCSIFDFNKNTWKPVKDMHKYRMTCGITYDTYRQNIYAGGGSLFSTIMRDHSIPKTIECYNFNKNIWFNNIPQTINPHSHPVLHIQSNGVIIIGGNKCNLVIQNKQLWGHFERLDTRDNIKKWHNITSIKDVICCNQDTISGALGLFKV